MLLVSGQKRKRSAGLDVPGVIVGAVVDAIATNCSRERNDEAAEKPQPKRAGEREREISKTIVVQRGIPKVRYIHVRVGRVFSFFTPPPLSLFGNH